MKKTLTVFALMAALTTPAFSDTVVEVKVPVNPTESEIRQAHENVMAAARDVCAAEPGTGLNVIERRLAISACVKATYSATIKKARDMQLVAFLADQTSDKK